MVGLVEAADDAPVLGVADVVGQVLAQRPAAGDVEHLHAAAHAEEGHPALERAARQRELEGVALGQHGRRLGVALGAVALGLDVGAAGEDERVDEVEQRVGVLRRAPTGCEQQRHAAGARDVIEVRAREQRDLVVPGAAPARALERDADTDDRWRGHHP